ncbi:MAG: histidinol-phosphate transaminase [Puniceicoccales bacterium]|jgi:histidinol-phosphate aminotransferase|nr:histidinol-phosphate transaminase [Puniceicoccales bacterium]
MSDTAASAFDVFSRAASAVAAQPAYTPGEQPQETGWIKLNTNENPFPPSPRVVAAIRHELGDTGAALRLYPSPASSPLRAAAARFHGVGVENVLAGNGSDDVLNLLVRAFSDTAKPAGMLEPSYSLYPVLSGLNAAAMVRVPVGLDGEFDVDGVARSGANIFFLTNPNAPLGLAFPPEKIAAVLRRFDGLLVVDEAYAPFADADATALLGDFPNLVISRTFSKAYALAGLRIGYALAHPDVIAVLDKVRDSYNLDRLAQAAGVAALEDRTYYAGTIATIKATRDGTAAALRARGWRVLPSQANFLLAAPPTAPPGVDAAARAADAFDFLKSNKVLVRYFPKNPLTAPFLRISIGTAQEMEKLLNILDTWAH